ncbi:MAG: hypothetical protein ACLFUT_12545 [Desulfobacteraceae bacterium]
MRKRVELNFRRPGSLTSTLWRREFSCAKGILGLRPGVHLMGLALAHAGRLRKYGA